MRRPAGIAAALGLVALSLPLAWARADHVRIGATQQPSTSTTVIAPAQVTVPMPPQTIKADEIMANQVRADTIYANRIEADEVQGQVHQTKDVKIRDTKGDIKAPEVAASIIYADEIKANSVIAQHVFVRELRRR